MVSKVFRFNHEAKPNLSRRHRCFQRLSSETVQRRIGGSTGKITSGSLACLAGFFLLLFAHQAYAQAPMQFSFHDTCGGGNANFCAPVMVGRGVFDETTLPSFRAALSQYRKV